MVNYGSPAGGLNRGAVIQSTKLELGTKHTEANSILQVMGPQEMYLGLLKQWQQYQIINVPLLSQTELQKNVLYTKSMGERLSYSVAKKYALPYVTEDINEGEKVGIGGEKFYLVLNTNRYTKSDLLTWSYEDGKQAIVCMDEDENPVPYGAGSYLYTMQVTSEDPRAYIPRRFVQAGVEWFKISNVKGEFSEENSSINLDNDGLETLMFQTGSNLQSVEHWMTGYADIIKHEVKSNAGSMDMSNKNMFADPHKASIMYLFDTLGDPTDRANRDTTKTRGADGTGIVPNSGTWMPLIMEWLYREQAKMQERHLMYNQGGVIKDAKGNLIRIGMGYYPQLKESGFYRTYSKPEQLMPLLRQITGDIFYGRPDIPLQDRRVKWKLGMGAMIEAQKYFNQYFKDNIVFSVFADHVALKGMLSGDNMNLRYEGYRFTAVRMPECGIIEIEHDPALDWEGNKSQTSHIGGYSTKSYRAFIEDLTVGSFSNAMPPSGAVTKGEGFDNGGNVVMIKPEQYRDVMTSFQIGDYCPEYLRKFVSAGQNGHISSMDKFGFKMKMFWAGEIWLKDPSRSILVELQDPLQSI